MCFVELDMDAIQYSECTKRRRTEVRTTAQRSGRRRFRRSVGNDARQVVQRRGMAGQNDAREQCSAHGCDHREEKVR